MENEKIITIYIVVENLTISGWQKEIITELEASKSTRIEKMINLEVKNRVGNSLKRKLQNDLLDNSATLLKEYQLNIKDYDQVELLDIKKEMITQTHEDYILESVTVLGVHEPSMILNFTSKRLVINNLSKSESILNFPFKGYSDLRIIDLVIDSRIKKDKHVDINIMSDHNGKQILKYRARFSAFFITEDGINEMSLSLIEGLRIIIKRILLNTYDDTYEYISINNDRPSLNFSRLKFYQFKLLNFFYYIRTLARSEFYLESWNIGIVKINLKELFGSKVLKGIKWRDSLNDYSFVADPFICKNKGEYYVLSEVIGSDSNKGFIASYKFDHINSKFSKPKTIFKMKNHLSYPYLIHHNDEVYCVPEMGETGNLTLYKAKSFPESWEEVSVLIKDRWILDASFINYNNKWWMFCSEMEDGPLSKLRIWYSDNLETGWIEHSLNPVVTDITCGRPGGAPFIHEGKLYRPAQNAEVSYGGSLVINEITEITPSSFKEKLAHELYPNKDGPYNDGLHTLSFIDEMIIIDGKHLSFSILKFFKWLIALIRKN